jgi:hypothetical protein
MLLDQNNKNSSTVHPSSIHLSLLIFTNLQLQPNIMLSSSFRLRRRGTYTTSSSIIAIIQSNLFSFILFIILIIIIIIPFTINTDTKINIIHDNTFGQHNYNNCNNNIINNNNNPFISTSTRTNDNDIHHDQQKQYPQIVWLMTFPNSGTSYTLRYVSTTTNTTVGTNYEQEIKYGKSIPIYPSTSTSTSSINNNSTISTTSTGPFILSNRKSIPNHYILTKTHCSGYCNDCPIDKYITNQYEFHEGCATNILSKPNPNLKFMTKELYHYKIQIPKVVRLIRDPFSNVVSNYHHWLGKKQSSLQENEFTKDANGFQTYCKMYNALFYTQIKKEKKKKGSMYIQHLFGNMKDLLKDVPCHQFFYRYVQWHNNANIVTKGIPTLIIHYEDYESSFSETTMKLLDFLNLDKVGLDEPFKMGKSYKDYYSDEQIVAISKFIRHLAQPATLDLISSYLVDKNSQ